MRALAALAILVAAGVPAVSTNAALRPSSQRPVLSIALRDPVTIVGRGFRAGERVRVTLPQQGVRVVRAGSRGGFVVSFAVGVHRCDLVRVVAVGSGPRAVLKVLPSPACLLDGIGAAVGASGAGASGRSAS
jgi:hypothetical protein